LESKSNLANRLRAVCSFDTSLSRDQDGVECHVVRQRDGAVQRVAVRWRQRGCGRSTDHPSHHSADIPSRVRVRSYRQHARHLRHRQVFQSFYGRPM